MLRLFSILETTFAEISFKLACNAKYRNGNTPLILRRCGSLQQAHIAMLSYNRNRPKLYLKWTKASYIKESIEYVLDINDVFYQNIQIHGSLINEMRIVRNHIAHRSTSTKNEYISLLQTKYGGNPNLTLGAFLTSTKRNPIANIHYYINASRIILNDITRGWYPPTLAQVCRAGLREKATCAYTTIQVLISLRRDCHAIARNDAR